jgi:lia operon protein LiaG
MKNFKTISFLLIIMMLISNNIGAMGQQSSGFDGNVNEERFYDLGDIKDLNVDVSSAEIRIMVVNNDKLRVHLHGTASGQLPFLDDKKYGRGLTIEVKRNPGLGFSRSNLILDIDLPKRYERNLTLNSSSGGISIPDLKLEELQVNMSSGDLSIESILTRVFIYDSSSGELTANRVESSESRLELSSGSVKIDRFTGDLDVEMSSGDVEISYINFNNTISIDSSSGDISITLPEDANFELDSETSSGKIICDYPITISGGQDRDQLKGIVGSGVNRIHVEASSGDISILKN